ncbi:MAG: protoporphyrinogen oxidase HemJ [Shimia sp.]
MSEFLSLAYPWIKVGHLASVIAWMAGLFYLPRLFVYHAERASAGGELDATFQVMEDKLYRLIMMPAMITTWTFGLILTITPGIVVWAAPWPWIKLVAVVAMTVVHIWCGKRMREFATGTNTRTGRTYRWANEAPTLLMLVILIAVIVRPF